MLLLGTPGKWLGEFLGRLVSAVWLGKDLNTGSGVGAWGPGPPLSGRKAGRAARGCGRAAGVGAALEVLPWAGGAGTSWVFVTSVQEEKSTEITVNSDSE